MSNIVFSTLLLGAAVTLAASLGATRCQVELTDPDTVSTDPPVTPRPGRARARRVERREAIVCDSRGAASVPCDPRGMTRRGLHAFPDGVSSCGTGPRISQRGFGVVTSLFQLARG